MKKLFPIFTMAVALATTAVASESNYRDKIRERMSTARTRAGELASTAGDMASSAGRYVGDKAKLAGYYGASALDSAGRAASTIGEKAKAGIFYVRDAGNSLAVRAKCQAVNSNSCSNPVKFAKVLYMGCKGSPIQNCVKKFCAANCAAATEDMCPTKDNEILQGLCKECVGPFFNDHGLHEQLQVCLKDPQVGFDAASARALKESAMKRTLARLKPQMEKFTKAYSKALAALKEYASLEPIQRKFKGELARAGVTAAVVNEVEGTTELPIVRIESSAPDSSSEGALSSELTQDPDN